MPGLTDFLLARIAEDEAVAQAAVQTTERGGADSWYWSNAGEAVFLDGTSTPVVWGDEQSRPAGNHIARHDPGRVLADCEVKRRIVKLASHPLEFERPGVLGAIAGLLALSYADHPDYDEEWRP
jgi:hypothetical protein